MSENLILSEGWDAYVHGQPSFVEYLSRIGSNRCFADESRQRSPLTILLSRTGAGGENARFRRSRTPAASGQPRIYERTRGEGERESRPPIRLVIKRSRQSHLRARFSPASLWVREAVRFRGTLVSATRRGRCTTASQGCCGSAAQTPGF